MLAVLLISTFAATAQQALPAEVRAACDMAFAIVQKTPGVKTRRSSGTFREEMFRAPVEGCRIDVNGSFKKAKTSGAPADNLFQGLDSRGWIELPDYSSDGHDGTSFAMRKTTVACFVRGEWDGGADDEPEVPPADPYRVTVICGTASQFVRPE